MFVFLYTFKLFANTISLAQKFVTLQRNSKELLANQYAIDRYFRENAQWFQKGRLKIK